MCCWQAHSSMSLSIILSASSQTVSKINLLYKTLPVLIIRTENCPDMHAGLILLDK